MEHNNPEPRLEPPEPFYITADCGHEVYEGESLFEWETYDQKTGKRKTVHICPDCFSDHIEKFSREEIADFLGLEHREIHAHGA